MVLTKKLLLFLLKLLVLLFVITFEKTVGLPIVFITLFLIFFINIFKENIYKYICLIVASMLLALVYSISFSLSLLLLVYLLLGINHGERLIANNINRILFFIYSFIMIMALLTRVTLDKEIIGYFIISSTIMIIFLMKTLFSRKKGINKNNNFFK